jgi:oxygen-dependent protoporphyrinogen oxidase
MAHVAVIGGGMAGLAAAYRLLRNGLETTVFEARDRIGGVIHSERRDGFLVEYGPNSIQSSSEVLDALMEELGLEDERIAASDAARMRYIVRDGRLVAAPVNPLELFTSELFRGGSKLRVLREPFVRPAHPAVEESVAQFIRRRLGSEILDFGFEPFVAGVYAGNVDLLSIRHAFPALYEMEQSSGSIVRGQIDKRRRAAAAVETHRMFSFRSGLEALPAALAEKLGDLRTDSAVLALRREGRAWMVHAEGQSPERFDAVVYAAPLHALDELDAPQDQDLSPLTAVAYAPLSVVALGFRRVDVGHPLDGFGMLVPRVEEPFRTLGTLFTSSIFPGRAPEGHVLLTSFLGGMRRPYLAGVSSDEAVGLVVRDLQRLLDVSGVPMFRVHAVWPRSIPQYELGYGTVLETMDRLERTWPGWFMGGNFRAGVSVAATAASGDEAARRCAAYLGS